MVVRTLGNVRHVPHLKRNTNSFSILDSKGYKYTCEGGVLNIRKGTCIVMKGKRSPTKLYVLQGSTVVSDAAVITPSILDDNIIMGKVSTHDNLIDMLAKSLFVAKFGH